jgi:tRNA pseudouridine55 synthase
MPVLPSTSLQNQEILTSHQPSPFCVDGFMLINKEKGDSSNRVVQQVRHLFGTHPTSGRCNQKAGHTGTLDPFAEGLMLITLGHATKLSQFLLDGDKTYEAVLQFGSQTDSADVTGEVIQTTSCYPSLTQIQSVIPQFLGEQQQTPPMFSALKHQGKALYLYARQGVHVERSTRKITIHRLEMINFDSQQQQLHFLAHCSKGTYIRTLAEDLATHCQSLGHLISLKRTAQQQWDLSQACSFSDLQKLTQAERLSCVLPMDLLISHLPSIYLDTTETARFLKGQRITKSLTSVECSDATNTNESPTYRVYTPQKQLLGMAKYRQGVIHPFRLLTDIQQNDR